MVLFSLVLICCSMYFLVTSRFGRKAAICASLILMLQKDVYLDKILSGMWENYLAIGVLLIFFALLHKYANCLSLKKAILLGILFLAVWIKLSIQRR